MSHLTLHARPEAAAQARRAVAAWLGSHPRLDDALLAVTELVNNAVIHGGLDPDDDLTVTIKPERNGIRLTVRHAGVLFDPHQSPSRSLEPGASRGLAIVRRIADRWGVDSDGAEVSAWFEVTPAIDDHGGR